jgi:hypothetical protein
MTVKMKHGFDAAGAFLSQSPPSSVSLMGGAVTNFAVAHEVDVDVIVGWPMALEIIQKGRSVGGSR